MKDAAVAFGQFFVAWFGGGGWIIFAMLSFLGAGLYWVLNEWFDSMDAEEEA